MLNQNLTSYLYFFLTANFLFPNFAFSFCFILDCFPSFRRAVEPIYDFLSLDLRVHVSVSVCPSLHGSFCLCCYHFIFNLFILPLFALSLWMSFFILFAFFVCFFTFYHFIFLPWSTFLIPILILYFSFFSLTISGRLYHSNGPQLPSQVFYLHWMCETLESLQLLREEWQTVLWRWLSQAL